jgi:hypothetical protein
VPDPWPPVTGAAKNLNTNTPILNIPVDIDPIRIAQIHGFWLLRPK